MRATSPEVNDSASSSMPSLKITPPLGINDSTSSGVPSFTKPAPHEADECFEMKGSRTT